MSKLWKRIRKILGLSAPRDPRKALEAILDHPTQRTPAEWRTWRKSTTARIRELLANKKGVIAARELSRAMLQDPDFPEFHTLLREAADIKLKRDAKSGKPDPWADLPKDLRQQALEVEGFELYVNEVEQLLDQAGFGKSRAPLPVAKSAAVQKKSKPDIRRN